MARIAVTPAQATEKWSRNLKQAGPSIIAGVGNVDEAPGIAAARQADKMLTNLTAAVTSGKWADRVSSVTLSEWQSRTVELGIPRIGAGADRAMPKMQNAMAQILAHEERILDQLAGMPSVTLEDNIQRAIFNMREMAKLIVTR